MTRFYWCRALPPRTKYSIVVVMFFTLYLLYIATSRKKSISTLYTVSTESIEGRTYTLAVRENKPGAFNYTVVLLHGERLDSTVWEETKTMENLYKKGYRVLAIDLPGNGNSRRYKPPKDDSEKAVILDTMLRELKATEAILVAPSMSGAYALPVVIRGSIKLKGFVPISPYSTEKYQIAEYSGLKIPTLIVYGLEDAEYGESSANLLQHIPDSKIHIINDGSHACYLQNPKEFNEVLLNFLYEIESDTFDSIRREQALKINSY